MWPLVLFLVAYGRIMKKCHNLFQTSDRRYKQNILPLESALQLIDSINPVSYTTRDESKRKYGFIAQDLYTTPPEPNIDIALVEYTEDSDDYGVRYTELIAPLVKAIQELSTKVQALEDA